MRKILTFGLVMITMLAMPASAMADIGVGVGTGKIKIDEQIKSGSIYSLPPITVFNSGSEKATYSMSVTLNEKQKELKPDPAWFSFEPAEFTLEPNKSQAVSIKLHPPVKTKPGDYFAYLEAHPSQKVKQGTTNVGVAAATKLNFSVGASNIFLGIYYRLLALYHQSEPYSQIAAGVILGGAVLYFLNKKLNLKAAFKGGWTAGRTHNNTDKTSSDKKHSDKKEKS